LLVEVLLDVSINVVVAVAVEWLVPKTDKVSLDVNTLVSHVVVVSLDVLHVVVVS